MSRKINPEKPAMLVLKYYDRGTLQYSYFTTGEKPLALHIASQYDIRGYRPRLYYSPYDGDGFVVLYDSASRAKKAAAAARKVSVKVAA